MSILIIFLAIYATLSNCSTSRFREIKPAKAIRDDFQITDADKNFSFYHSTLPVPGLDAAIWRQDLTGQLLLAGYYGCEGCLCYTFDHRLPIDAVKAFYTPERADIRELMTSQANIQAINYRANLFKSNLDEEEVQQLMPLFGCDRDTMAKFTQNNFAGAKKFQAMTFGAENTDYRLRMYEDYKAECEKHEAEMKVKLTEEFKLEHPEEARAELNRRAAEVRRSIFGR